MFNTSVTYKSSILSLATLFFIGCGGESGTNLNQTIGVETKGDYIEISSSQQELLDALNLARSEARDCYPDDPTRGLMKATHPLTWNTELYASALEHSTDLAQSNTFSHNGSGTNSDTTGNGRPSKFYERIIANGYSNYYSVGENIAGGQQSLEEVMNAWIASPGHCANIMNDKYTEVGIAIVTDTNSLYGIYWTQNFGSKR